MTYKIKLLETVQLTPDTAQYIFSKPDAYEFKPGQATDLAINRDGWRDEDRPFTFTSDPDASVLSFVIKSYTDHEGVTKELLTLQPGETVRFGDPWGAIEDKGFGTFIAGGAGITPFLGILRDRARRGELEGCHLIFANKKPEDIILHPLWQSLDDLRTTFVVSEGADGDHHEGEIDEAFLDGVLENWDGRFYVCGPPALEDAVTKILKYRGVSDDHVIREN